MSVILIGMPGCGKTTAVDLYKKIYSERAYDTDAFIESKYGNIAAIFSRFGEKRFRDIETETIREICGYGDDALIATGGGAVLREENVCLFKQCGKIVYLRTQLETLLERLDGDLSRPLLSGDKKARLTALYNERTPLYERVADFALDTDGVTPAEILKKIIGERR